MLTGTHKNPINPRADICLTCLFGNMNQSTWKWEKRREGNWNEGRKEIRDCRTYLPGYLSRFIISYCRWSHALLADEEGRGEFLKPCPIEFAYIGLGRVSGVRLQALLIAVPHCSPLISNFRPPLILLRLPIF